MPKRPAASGNRPLSGDLVTFTHATGKPPRATSHTQAVIGRFCKWLGSKINRNEVQQINNLLIVEGPSRMKKAAGDRSRHFPRYNFPMPDDSDQYMTCMEVWGGNQLTDRGVQFGGLDAWVHGKPLWQRQIGYNPGRVFWTVHFLGVVQ